jgi:protein-disulfide isomerase
MSRLIVPALVATAALLAGCASPPAGPAGGPPPAAEPAPATFNVIGREDAPVTIIEFTDLQCPYCARHAARTFPQLKRDYVDTGRLRYASRDLPLPFHAFALPAAVASRCAGEQGRFWEYRDALFASQGTLGTEPYGRIAGELGLDVARLEACRSDGRQEAAVRADIALAAQYGIRSTPTFVIGRVVDGEFQGEVVSGAQPYEFFAAKLDALLAAPR